MTDNPASVVDEGTFTVRRTIQIAAPIEKVWRAVTEPEHISKWFGQARFEGSGAGSGGTLTWPGRDPIPVRDRCGRRPQLRLLPLGQRRREPDAGRRARRRPLDGLHVHAGAARTDGTRLTVVETGFETTSDPIANLEESPRGLGRRAGQAGRPARGRRVSTGTLVPVFAALGDETAVEHPGGTRRGRCVRIRPRRPLPGDPSGDREAPRRAAGRRAGRARYGSGARCSTACSAPSSARRRGASTRSAPSGTAALPRSRRSRKDCRP